MGYFEIGIYHGKKEVNIGTLWRSAYQLGAAGIFTIGRRYSRQASDTVDSIAQVPMRHYLDFEEFLHGRPLDSSLVAIEMGGRPLAGFVHPKQAVYLLGAEDSGLPPEVIKQCDLVVSLEAVNMSSYNVAVAGSIVMYHRIYRP